MEFFVKLVFELPTNKGGTANISPFDERLSGLGQRAFLCLNALTTSKIDVLHSTITDIVLQKCRRKRFLAAKTAEITKIDTIVRRTIYA